MHEFNSLDYTPNLSVGVRVCCCWCLAYPNDKEKAFCWGHKIFKIKKKEEKISFWLALVFSHIFPYELLTLSLWLHPLIVSNESKKAGGKIQQNLFYLITEFTYKKQHTSRLFHEFEDFPRKITPIWVHRLAAKVRSVVRLSCKEKYFR